MSRYLLTHRWLQFLTYVWFGLAFGVTIFASRNWGLVPLLLIAYFVTVGWFHGWTYTEAELDDIDEEFARMIR